MKTILLIINLFVLNVANANLCEQISPNAKKFKEQKNYIKSQVSLGELAVPSTLDPVGNHYVEEFSINKDYPVSVEMDLSEKYNSIEKFKTICMNENKNLRTLLSTYRRDLNVVSGFKIKLPFLFKGDELFFKNQNVSYSNSSNVRINANSESILKMVENDDLNLNQTESFGVTHVDLLNQKLTAELMDQIRNNPGQEKFLNLDGQDDLICDLLTGNASISIGLWFKFDSNKLVLNEEVYKKDVQRFYDEFLTVNGKKLADQNKSFFNAGLVWNDLKNSRMAESIRDDKVAYDIALKFVENDIKQESADENLQCLAESMSTYLSYRQSGSMGINLKPVTSWQIK